MLAEPTLLAFSFPRQKEATKEQAERSFIKILQNLSIFLAETQLFRDAVSLQWLTNYASLYCYKHYNIIELYLTKS